jgi:Zn-dependent M28 family amino/carboxypeptidase
MLIKYRVIVVVIFFTLISGCKANPPENTDNEFNGERAYGDVAKQLEFGPRTPGSEAHQEAIDWMVMELKASNWQVDAQEAIISGTKITNVIAKRGSGKPWIILGSHYDSRLKADQDTAIGNRQLPVPGANDGASSTAILIELARVIPERINKHIWLAFFDAEDLSASNIATGSQSFVNQLEGKPDSVVVLDMLGDKDLNINMEWNSNPDLNKEIWETAAELGYSQFIPTYKYRIIDDHIPFIQADIRAIDIIDFDYPYWHTTQDTLDKISADSLKAVGDTMLKWLEK